MHGLHRNQPPANEGDWFSAAEGRERERLMLVMGLPSKCEPGFREALPNRQVADSRTRTRREIAHSEEW
jgi:hypothetical protein